MNVRVRAATPEDADAIGAVHVESWRWAYRGQLPDDLLDGLDPAERGAGWGRILETGDADVIVAEDDDRIVGFASASASRDDDATAATGEVLTVYVVEEAVGTGAGRALLAGAQGLLRARGHTRATLWVLESNDRARRFYERNGWTWDGARGEHQVECANRPIVRYAADL
jgi:GNAT superfamily N-acetyltransferase